MSVCQKASSSIYSVFFPLFSIYFQISDLKKLLLLGFWITPTSFSSLTLLFGNPFDLEIERPTVCLSIEDPRYIYSEMGVDMRQIVAGILTLTMFVMLGNMIKRDHFDSVEVSPTLWSTLWHMHRLIFSIYCVIRPPHLTNMCSFDLFSLMVFLLDLKLKEFYYSMLYLTFFILFLMVAFCFLRAIGEKCIRF